jgi:hypothetical protein
MRGGFFTGRSAYAYMTIRKTFPRRELENFLMLFQSEIGAGSNVTIKKNLRARSRHPQMQNKLRIFSEIGDPACVAHVFFHIINTGSEDEFIVNIQWWKSPNCGGSKHGRG